MPISQFNGIPANEDSGGTFANWTKPPVPESSTEPKFDVRFYTWNGWNVIDPIARFDFSVNGQLLGLKGVRR